MNTIPFGMLWAIAIGGATGSVSRYLISQWMQRLPGNFPVATFLINVSGSFLIALFWFMMRRGLVDSSLGTAGTRAP